MTDARPSRSNRFSGGFTSSEDRAVSRRREALRLSVTGARADSATRPDSGPRPEITGTVLQHGSGALGSDGASCVITTDRESPRLRQSSHVQSIELRTYVFLDSLQPQLAAYMGTVSQGFLPIPGDACLWLEVSPGMAVHRVTDIALKASTVRLGQMVVERAFGSIAMYHRDQSNVLHSGEVVLEAIGSSIERRSRCDVTWTEIIRAITPDHAVLINRQNRRGSMIQSGMSMFILETEPAGYVLIAANEAEKASNITVVDVKAVGAFGRLTLAGREGDVEEAAAAAMRAVQQING